MGGQDGVRAPRRVVAVRKPGRSASGAMVQMAGTDAHLPHRAGAATLMDVLAILQPQDTTATEEVTPFSSIGIP